MLQLIAIVKNDCCKTYVIRSIERLNGALDTLDVTLVMAARERY
jgi:hypothetical protein